MLLSPDGRTVLQTCGRDDWAVVLWDVETGTKIQTLPSLGASRDCGCFSPDSRALTFLDGELIVWDLVHKKERLLDLNSDGQCVAYSPDGHTLAVATLKEVQLWDIRLDLGVVTTAIDAVTGKPVPAGKLCHPGGYSLTTEGHLTYSRDKQVPHPKPSRERVERLAGRWPGWKVERAVHSPDGGYLAIVLEKPSSDPGGFSDDHRLSVLDTWTEAELLALQQPPGYNVDHFSELAFTPDGRTLAVARDDLVELYRLPSGQHRATLHARRWDDIISLGFTDDGNALVWQTIGKYSTGGTVFFDARP
jgi:WD40 repeat protein